MIELNYLAVAAATVAPLLVSGVYYAALSSQMVQLRDEYRRDSSEERSAASTVPVELGRNLVVAVVIAVVAGRMGITDWAGAVVLALALWVAFPVVLLSGSIFHERYPVKLAVIHAGDWLLKLLVITLITTLWR